MKKRQNQNPYVKYFLIAVVLFTIFVRPKPVSAATQKNWYKSVLENVNKSYTVKDRQGVRKKIYLRNYTHYKVLDINGDGTKELLLSASKGSKYQSVVVFTYYKKKVKPLIYLDNMDDYASARLSCKNKYLCDYFRTPETEFAGTTSYSFYQLKKGKLKLTAKTEYIHGISNKDGSLVRKYYINGKKCSKTKYLKYLKKYKKYYTKGKKISFSPIPVNVNKVLRLLKGSWHTWGIDCYGDKSGYRYTVEVNGGCFLYTDLAGNQIKNKIISITRTDGGYWIKVKGSGGSYFFKYEVEQPDTLYYFNTNDSGSYSGTSSLEREQT